MHFNEINSAGQFGFYPSRPANRTTITTAMSRSSGTHIHPLRFHRTALRLYGVICTTCVTSLPGRLGSLWICTACVASLPGRIGTIRLTPGRASPIIFFWFPPHCATLVRSYLHCVRHVPTGTNRLASDATFSARSYIVPISFLYRSYIKI